MNAVSKMDTPILKLIHDIGVKEAGNSLIRLTGWSLFCDYLLRQFGEAMAKSKSIVRVGTIQHRILLIRGHKVIIDADLADAYGVPTRRLNEQVKRIANLKFSKALP